MDYFVEVDRQSISVKGSGQRTGPLLNEVQTLDGKRMCGVPLARFKSTLNFFKTHGIIRICKKIIRDYLDMGVKDIFASTRLAFLWEKYPAHGFKFRATHESRAADQNLDRATPCQKL